jgi:hypothetical protein
MNAARLLTLPVLALAALGSAGAAAPTPASLEAALTAAEAEWGYTVTEPIEFRVEALNSCRLTREPLDVATTQVVDIQSRMTFDGVPAGETTHAYTYVIKLNANCDWAKLPVQQIITHELGHVIMGAAHSTDRKSVMYPVSKPHQVVTPADRAVLAAIIERRECGTR